MRPTSEDMIAEAVKTATGPLRIKGGGTRDIGKPVLGEVLDLSGLSGITLYEPGALTLVAQAGTPVAEIEKALAKENQRLAFEPMDHRALLGTKGKPTIGGAIAAGASGPRRIAVGAARDHMLGVRFVDGNGTIIKNGGRVMKNVTGYDLVKLMTGSYGTLGALTEVSLKVLPKPETQATLVLHDLSLSDSVAAMSEALGSPFEVTGAALHGLHKHDPVYCEHGQMTCIRLEGFEDSVRYRVDRLKDLLKGYGDITVLDATATASLWTDIRDVTALKDHAAVTRVSIKPSAAPEFAECLWQTLGADVMLDWGGGLMWFGMKDRDAKAAKNQFMDEPYTETEAYGLIHATLQEMVTHEPGGGHATLIKGPEATRASVKVFQPENPTVSALSAGLRTKFDPRGILNPGLMAA